MSLFVLDSDILDLYQTGHPTVCARVRSHPAEELATTVITVKEHLSGWYTLLRRAKDATRLARAYQRLADSVVFLACFHILSFTEVAIERYEQLKRLKLGTKKMDLRIAAITLVHGGTLVTRKKEGTACGVSGSNLGGTRNDRMAWRPVWDSRVSFMPVTGSRP